MGENTREDAFKQWKDGGYSKTFTLTYAITVDTTTKWPITLWDSEDCPCEIDKEDFEIIVAESVADFGLTQSTLWNAYREHGVDVNILRSRRNGT